MRSKEYKSPLELEIQSLLILHRSVDQSVSALMDKYKNLKCDFDSLEIISIFFLHAGYPSKLIQLLVKQISLGSLIPWGHFAEALAMTRQSFDPTIYQALLCGAEEQNLLWHLARCDSFRPLDPRLTSELESHTKSQWRALESSRNECLEQIEMLRTQELDAEEGKLLDQLSRQFPSDLSVQAQMQSFQRRLAIRTLEQHSERQAERSFEISRVTAVDLPPEQRAQLNEITKTMLEAVQSAGPLRVQMALDFSLAHSMMDNPEGAAQFAELALTEGPSEDEKRAGQWLKIEALLNARKFLELTQTLDQIEQQGASDPDTTFACVYYRAQALWGLNQKFAAIDLMDSLVGVNPHYRAAATLLSTWKQVAR